MMGKAAGIRRKAGGFSTVELLVGLVVGSLVLAATYRMWSNSQAEGFRLQKKIELRNQMALSSKRIQRAITLAGLGLKNAPNIQKDDAVGSDTLVIYTNLSEQVTTLVSDVSNSQTFVTVTNGSLFQGVNFLALTDSAGGEIRRITQVSGSTVLLDAHFTRAFSQAASNVSPARQEKYYTDQETNQLICQVNNSSSVVGREIKNFQVSFRNRNGESTEIPGDIRAVTFSFTGIFPAKPGALSSVIFSSTAIPRNTI